MGSEKPDFFAKEGLGTWTLPSLIHEAQKTTRSENEHAACLDHVENKESKVGVEESLECP